MAPPSQLLRPHTDVDQDVLYPLVAVGTYLYIY